MSYIVLHLRRSLFYFMCSVFFPELKKDKILTSIVFLNICSFSSRVWAAFIGAVNPVAKWPLPFFLFVGFGSLFFPFISTD